MTTRTMITTALCCLVGLSNLQAEETVQAAVPQVAAQAPAANATHPYYETGFYPSWSKMTPKAGVEDTRAAMALTRARIAGICAIEPGKETYENVFAVMESAQNELECVETYMHNLASVMDNDELREAMESLIPEQAAFSAEISGNEQLWQVIKRAAAQPWVQELSPAKKRFVQQVVDSFRDGGADLPADKKARKQAINTEMAKLQHQFSKNVLDSTKAWFHVVKDPAELAGLPEGWMKKAAEAAAKRGFGTPENPNWLITLEFTSMGEVMRCCTVEATRKLCWEGQNTIGKGGKFDNEAIVARIMELRKEYAQLLGADNFADKVCKHRMVDTGAKALAFVDDMMQKVLPDFKKESRELLDFVSARTGKKVDALNPWDRRFYMDQLSKERYNFDSESMRPYLRSDNVLKGMFSIYSHLYDITISELPTVCLKAGESCPEGKVEVWHPEVQVFKVTDNKTGAHLGSFYYDPYPRPSKRAGAWVSPMRPGYPAADGKPHTPHLAALVGNLSQPMGKDYALYSQYDVETVFHEFGHMLHNMLSDTELRAHSGSSVAWDFVELPSQINENWTWEPEGIATYAFHHETGEPIPADLVKKLIDSRFFMPATDDMGQLCLAKLDLEMHMHYADGFAGKPLDEATNQLLAPWRIPMTAQSPSIMRHLTHCVTGGYAAGYFCYKWAEVLAADAFTRFEKEGVMNPETGAAFRNCILKNGDSRPAGDLYRDFMGRDPNPDALLEKQGLHTPSGK